MTRTKGLAALLGLVLTAASWPAHADVQRLACDGAVYEVSIEAWHGNARQGGTILRTSRQRAKGGKESFVVTGTDDPVPDQDPALEIDPSSRQPVIVWSRGDDGAKALYVSRFEEGWSEPQQIIDLEGDDVEPQIHYGGRYAHVSWRETVGEATVLWRASFDPATFQVVYGPERIPTDDVVSIPPEGGPEINTVGATDQYFCTSVLGRTMADPVRSYIWGVRDEPVPVGYRQSFALPLEVGGVNAQAAEFLGGRLTYWFTTSNPDRLYYTTLRGSRWTEMRLIELAPQTSAADARWLVEENNRRGNR